MCRILIRCLALILGLLSAGLLIEKNVDFIASAYSGLENRCPFSEKTCSSILTPIHPIAELRFDMRRRVIPLHDLPILRISMSGGALEKLLAKRDEAWARYSPIHFTEEDDEVKAVVEIDDGITRRKVKAKIRLKGDNVSDHFRDRSKLSMRIKIRGGEHILGMSRFSIQRPETRNNQEEALIMDMMRQFGVLAPRYLFAEVHLNDKRVGVMAIEEHMTTEMIESQQRPAGPLLNNDQDPFWRQLDLVVNNHPNPKALDVRIRVPGNYFRIKTFNHKEEAFLTPSGADARDGMAMYRDFVDERLSSDEVFDLELLARWWILANLWRSDHGFYYGNVRFYFNPITRVLEPVSYDNATARRSIAGWREISVITNPIIEAALKAPEFKSTALKNIVAMRRVFNSKEFQTWFRDKQETDLQILAIDSIFPAPVSVGNLLNNLNHLERFVTSSDTESTAPKMKFIDDPTRVRRYYEAMMKRGLPFYLHLRSFLYPSGEGLKIELENLMLEPVFVEGIYSDDQREIIHFPQPIMISPTDTDSNTRIELPVRADEHQNINNLSIRYVYQGEEYRRPIHLQFRGYKSEFPGPDEVQTRFLDQGVHISDRHSLITFPAGDYLFTQSLETPRDWTVVFLPGAKLRIRSGAIIRLRGPLLAIGKKEAPIEISIQSILRNASEEYWGGLLVESTDQQSILEHVKVEGMGSVNIKTRKDRRGLTGCVTFYRSRVKIRDSEFINLQCEDSLNIVSSEFEIKNATFKNTIYDGLDSDFSIGTIKHSTFEHIGNDGVDLSNSEVNIQHSHFSLIGDKAISVGEKTNLYAKNIHVLDSMSGVVSKDGSSAVVESSEFTNITNSALMAYVKKDEFGNPELNCQNCVFNNVGKEVTQQIGSRVKIDGQFARSGFVSRREIFEAGHLQ